MSKFKKVGSFGILRKFQNSILQNNWGLVILNILSGFSSAINTTFLVLMLFVNRNDSSISNLISFFQMQAFFLLKFIVIDVLCGTIIGLIFYVIVSLFSLIFRNYKYKLQSQILSMILTILFSFLSNVIYIMFH
jgi:uncharacterized protein YacL